MKHALAFSGLIAAQLVLTSATGYAAGPDVDKMNKCPIVFGAAEVAKGAAKAAAQPAILQRKLEAKTVEQMLAEHKAKGNPVIASRKLRFIGTEGRDVYNQTSMFKAKLGGVETEVKFARVEPRANHESEVWAFKHLGDGVYEPIASIAHFKGEDPFFEMIDSELWIGFVETFDLGKGDGSLGYRTVLYRDGGKGVDHLKRAVELPAGMKDTRFAKVIAGKDKGRIRLVARPQAGTEEGGGRGKNAFANVSSMEHVDSKSVKEAKILQDQVVAGEWIGTNKVFSLENGDVVYLSHVAYFENPATGQRGYFVTTYSDRFPEPSIILTRSDIESLDSVKARGASKRPDLVNVLFSGGFREVDAHTGVLDVGEGDAEATEVVIPNFLTKYRQGRRP